MPRIEATMSIGYQMTVPSALRKRLGLKPLDKLVFDTDKAEVTVEKGESREEKIKHILEDLDHLKKEREKTMTPKQKKFAEMSRGWTINQYHEYFDNLPETQEYIKEKYGV